jgi:RNA-directed DNA polymerase
VSDILLALTEVLPLTPDELLTLIRSAPMRYKVYTVPKRAPGKLRTIAQPAREVKALQYWVMSHFLTNFPIDQAAMAYRRGKNIADNARPHANSRFLLKLDFKDFFPSIRDADFKRFLAKSAPFVNDTDAELLTRILFWRPKGTRHFCLAIGAPSSPLLSNILLLEFDRAVSQFCASLGVIYTRYADDLSFSSQTSQLLADAEEKITELCAASKDPHLVLNRDKTVRVSKKRSRRVTGLVLTNEGNISLGRNAKREIRSTVHHFLTGKLTREQGLSLRGTLAYVNSVEPNFLNRLRAKYGSDSIRRIQTFT